MSKPVTPSEKEIDAFISAAGFGENWIVTEFLDKYSSFVDEKGFLGRTALTAAVMNGHKDTVELLLEKGAGINEKGRDGWTPLIYAVKRSNWDDMVEGGITRLLLEKGADTDEGDDDGETPLITATQNGNESLVKLLLDHGADRDKKDKYGGIALTYAYNKEVEARLLEWTEEQKQIALAKDIADFSPALKRTIPATRPVKVAPRGGMKP